MKKIIISFAAAVCALSPSLAQQKWTLRQCIDHAVENNISIRRTELQVRGAETDLNTAQNSRLPGLDAGAGQNFGFGRTSVRYEDPETGASYDRYENTQAASSNFSVSAGVPLFQGFSISNRIKAGRLDLQAAAEGLERAKQDLELSIAAYYLDVLFKKEILAVYREQTALTREQVANTRVMVDEGKVARAQLYDIEAKLAQNEVNETGAKSDLDLSLLTLSQALNLGHSPDFDVADADTGALDPGSFPSLRSPGAVYEMAVGSRPAVREAELKLQSSEFGVKIAQAARMPSLSLSADISTGYQYAFGQSVAQQNFSDQIRNRLSEGVGLSLRIPIFNRLATRNSIRSARLGVQDQMLALDGVKQALYKEIEQAYQGAVAAETRYEATSRALAAAEEAARAMTLRYANGKATAYEYNEANTQLAASRSDQAQAKYDYLFRTKILDFYTGRPIEI